MPSQVSIVHCCREATTTMTTTSSCCFYKWRQMTSVISKLLSRLGFRCPHNWGSTWNWLFATCWQAVSLSGVHWVLAFVMIQLMSLLVLLALLSVTSTLGEETANLQYEPPPRLQSIQNKYDGVHSRKGCNGIEELPVGRTNTTTRLQALRWHCLSLLLGHKALSFQDGDGKGGLGRLRGAQHRRSSGGCTVETFHMFQPRNVGQDS